MQQGLAERRQHALDAAFTRAPERFVAGQPVAARPPKRVMLNPLDAAPPTVSAVLGATDDALDNLWPPPSVGDIPVINLPGAALPQAAAANAT